MLSLPEIASDHNSKREIDFHLYEEQRLQHQINVAKLFGEYRELKEDLKLVHVYSNGNRSLMMMMMMMMMMIILMIILMMMMNDDDDDDSYNSDDENTSSCGYIYHHVIITITISLSSYHSHYHQYHRHSLYLTSLFNR